MKTNIVLNIGLETTKGTPVELHHAIHEMERAGITCLASGVITGEWEGKQEQTLVICGLAYDSFELRPRLYSASRALSQHCIALWKDGKGELVGENPQGYTFDLALFHFHPREEKRWEIPSPTDADIAKHHAELLAKAYPPQLSDCQAIQAKHASKAAEIAEADKRQEHVSNVRAKLREMLEVNRWEPGSAKALAAEYAFTLGIESVTGRDAWLTISRMSGRSILE